MNEQARLRGVIEYVRLPSCIDSIICLDRMPLLRLHRCILEKYLKPDLKLYASVLLRD